MFEPLLERRTARVRVVGLGARRRRPGTRTVAPEGIVVVEGVCALHRMFRDDYDVRVWVEAPYDDAARARRRARRRGRARTWVEHWMPMEERYIARDDPISCADVVVDGLRVGPSVHLRDRGRMRQRQRPGGDDASNPSTVLATAALFFALGGSALAISEAVKPQARCQPGAVRGFIAVNGDPTKGIANLSDQFTSAKPAIGAKFNCAGAAPQARRVSQGVYEVRFPGNAAQVATASSGTAETTIDTWAAESSG